MNKDFAERIRFPMPTSELERRWKLVREAMGSQGIDLLVMQNDNLWLGGYVRYFTDIPAEHAYPVSVLFPLDDEMTIITSSSPRGPLPPAWSVRGVKNRIGTPYIRTLNYSNTLDAEAICKIIKERKDKVVGLVNLGLINTVLSSYLKDNLPNVQFVDAADLVDEIKAVKSEVELGFIRKAVEMHDTICEAMPLIVYPGVYEYQVRNQIKEILCNLGSEEQLIKLGSAPAGVSTPFLDTFMQNRQIREGDYFRIMVEASGPAGYYSEIQRTWCLCEPDEDTIYAWELSKKVQMYAAGLLKPGAKPSEIMQKINTYLVSLDQPEEGRLFGHGQGLDLVERPGISLGETIELKTNMVMNLHCGLYHEKALGYYANNYLITENGAELMHKTPMELLRL